MTLSTVTADGAPHVVPVGATMDFPTATARVITSEGSVKVRNLRQAGPPGAPASLCQVSGRHWVTVSGRATVSADPDEVRDAELRYAVRYRTPRPNLRRVVIILRVDKIMGSL